MTARDAFKRWPSGAAGYDFAVGVLPFGGVIAGAVAVADVG
jgi:hypothetical protein